MSESVARRLYVDGPFGQVHLRDASPGAAGAEKMKWQRIELSGVLIPLGSEGRMRRLML